MNGWKVRAEGGHDHGVGAVIASRHRRYRTRPRSSSLKLPDQINWKENATAGNANAVLYGDPSKPGLYIVLVKWHAGRPTIIRRMLNMRGSQVSRKFAKPGTDYPPQTPAISLAASASVD